MHEIDVRSEDRTKIITDLRKKLLASQQNVNELTDQILKIKKQNKQNEESTQTLTMQNTNFQSSLESYQNEINDLKTHTSNQAASIDQLMSELQMKNHTIKRLQKEIREC